jgi:hypothetical protein
LEAGTLGTPYLYVPNSLVPRIALLLREAGMIVSEQCGPADVFAFGDVGRFTCSKEGAVVRVIMERSKRNPDFVVMAMSAQGGWGRGPRLSGFLVIEMETLLMRHGGVKSVEEKAL